MTASKTISDTLPDIGTITIRVVVVAKQIEHELTPSAPEDLEADEVLPEQGRSPLSSYLEDPKRGRLCCVFLVNGQRQHGWDNAFIVRDLQLKYLRNRVMVIVEVDGLRPEALAELMQGSRSNFYEGRVYDAIASRVIAVLKGDEDLQRLEAEAEEEISALRSGDEVVKGALDELIESHFSSADHTARGTGQKGSEQREGPGGTTSAATESVTLGDPSVGIAGDEPVIVLVPDSDILRVIPGEVRRFLVACRPSAAWAQLESLTARVRTHTNDFLVVVGKMSLGGHVDVAFHAPQGMDQDEYPIDTSLLIEAKFTGLPELRTIDRPLRVQLQGHRPPPPPPVLLLEPTWLRVGGRQPLRLLSGGPDLHVKCRWNGKDELTGHPNAAWTFGATCLDQPDWPVFAFSQPNGGRFELLIRSPEGLEIGTRRRFQVEASGPSGRKLTAVFECEVVLPAVAQSPRKITTASDVGQHRRPPYQLKYVTRSEWPITPCWDAAQWTANDVGCFQEPTVSAPLTLVLNQDYSQLDEYRESLIARKLTESTIAERTTRYSAHVAYHLYQMYLSTLNQGERSGPPSDEPSQGDRLPDEADYRAEVSRVAGTLLRLMEFSR
jgi:hypothetical protein